MGAKCSCIQENTFTTKPGGSERVPTMIITRPDKPRRSYISSHDVHADLEENAKEDMIYQLNEIPRLKPNHCLPKSGTNDSEKKTSPEESNDLSDKKLASFTFSSNRLLSDPKKTIPFGEFINPRYGINWKVQNIKLVRLMQSSDQKTVWESENRVTQIACKTKIQSFEASLTASLEISRSDFILRQLSLAQSPNVVQVFSYAIYRYEITKKEHYVILANLESGHYNLKQLYDNGISKMQQWREDDIIWIISQIINALEACKSLKLTHDNLKMENILFDKDLSRLFLSDFKSKDSENEVNISQIKGRRNGFGAFGKAPEKPKSTSWNELSQEDSKALIAMTKRLLTNGEELGQLAENRQDFQRITEIMRYLKEQKTLTELNKLCQSSLEKAQNGIDLTRFILPGNTPRTVIEKEELETAFQKIEIYTRVNSFGAALEKYKEVIQIVDRKTNITHQQYKNYIQSGIQLVKHYIAQKDFQCAYEIANDLETQLKDHQDVKVSLYNQSVDFVHLILLFGKVYEGLKEPEKALQYYTRGLQHQSVKKISNEAFQNALQRIVSILFSRGKEDEAFLYLQILTDSYLEYEQVNLDSSTAFTQFGHLLKKQGKKKQALSFYMKSLEILKKEVDQEEAVLRLLEIIINCYLESNEEENALLCELETLDLKRQIYGRKSQTFLSSVKKVADSFQKMKRYSIALEYYSNYVSILKDCGLEEKYVESLVTLGDIFLKTKNYDQAITIFKEYSQLVEKKEGPKSKKFLISQDQIARAIFRKGVYKVCLDIQLENLKTKLELYERDDFYIIVSLNNIGDTLFALGYYQDALAYHLECYNLLENKSDEEKKKAFKQILLNVALDYRKLGNHGKGLEYVYRSHALDQPKDTLLSPEGTNEVYELMTEQDLNELDFTMIIRKSSQNL